MEEEKQAIVDQVSDLLGWVKGLQGRTRGPNAGSSLAAQQVHQKSGLFLLHTFFCKSFAVDDGSCLFSQAISEQLAAKKEDVAEAMRSTQVFLLSKQASK